MRWSRPKVASAPLILSAQSLGRNVLPVRVLPSIMIFFTLLLLLFLLMALAREVITEAHGEAQGPTKYLNVLLTGGHYSVRAGKTWKELCEMREKYPRTGATRPCNGESRPFDVTRVAKPSYKRGRYFSGKGPNPLTLRAVPSTLLSQSDRPKTARFHGLFFLVMVIKQHEQTCPRFYRGNVDANVMNAANL